MTTQQTLQTLSYADPYPRQKPQLLIDISGIIRYDSRTGIPRVVKSQLHALTRLDQDICSVEPIYLDTYDNTPPLHFYASTRRPLSLKKGDILYTPDLDPQSVKEATCHRLYRCYKNLGVSLVTLIHDILPITHPEFFVKGQDAIHKEWLSSVLAFSDMLITTSDATKDALSAYAPHHPPIYTVAPGVSLPPVHAPSIPSVQTEHPSFLVVSTLEPRKAHAQLLDAFEILWAKGYPFPLTFVGKQGWHVESLIERIRTHPQNGKLLCYKAFVADEELNALYTNADALIVASYAEGFGLPLIEAAHRGLSLVVRDIPVFREVASTHAYYFPDTRAARPLADAILAWSRLYANDAHPKTARMPYNDQTQNARLLLERFAPFFLFNKM
jgi:glycosyltransferase involved in cell wall biosynthesis